MRASARVFGGAAAVLIALARPLGAAPLALWNQAYQENSQPDALPAILEGARDAYVLLDPFDAEDQRDWPHITAQLKSRGNQPGAYISIGTGEAWRADFARLRPSLVARPWDEWDGEYFVNRTDANALGVMRARIDWIAAAGFDWVEFDNMDWADDDDLRARYGFAVTVAEARRYAQALCDHAHRAGLRCMAKNSLAGAGAFDGVTYESYPGHQGWWDMEAAHGFLAAGKPVVIFHYEARDCAATRRWYARHLGPSASVLCESQRAGGYLHSAN